MVALMHVRTCVYLGYPHTLQSSCTGDPMQYFPLMLLIDATLVDRVLHTVCYTVVQGVWCVGNPLLTTSYR